MPGRIICTVSLDLRTLYTTFRYTGKLLPHQGFDKRLSEQCDGFAML